MEKNSIRCFRNFVPERLRLWIMILWSFVFLLSGASHMATMNMQVSRFSFIQEDATMIGFMAFIGMNISFPMLFRLRFRFTTRELMLASSFVLILCHICLLATDNVALLCCVSLVAGFFRMLAVFEAMVCIQLIVTPSRNYAVFYSVVFVIVQGSSQLFTPVITDIVCHSSWIHFQWIVILSLVITAISIMVLIRHYREGKRIPLYGIDWLGFILWGVILTALLFIMTYGKYLEWGHSLHIRFAIIVLTAASILQYMNIKSIKRPYINPAAWKYPKLMKIFVLFGAIYIIQAAPGMLQNPYMGSVLKFDQQNISYLSYFSLGGMIISALLCYTFFRKRKRLRGIIIGGYCLFIVYLVMMYFYINPECNIEKFYFPAFIRGFALLWLYIILTLYISYIVPFVHNFQSLCIIGFMRMSLGTPIGMSLIDNMLLFLQRKNLTVLNSEIDFLNLRAIEMPYNDLASLVNQQIYMVSVKEMFGYLITGAVVLLIIMLFERRVQINNFKYSFPTMKQIRLLARHLLNSK